MKVLLATVLALFGTSCATKVNLTVSAILPIVETKFGTVRGGIRFSLASDRPVYSFFGVKYGRRPDYLFRFREPRDPWEWTNIRDVSSEHDPPLCYQHEDRLKKMVHNHFMADIIPKNYTLSEDCLTVDIFTPSPSKNSMMPVIAWIHGGSFQTYGSSRKLWAIPSLQDVVVVQIQYRLGPFGFYSSEDEWAIQNTGFHDQVKALQWIRDNVKEFGGNPEAVTLMGQSAGGVAVTAHMLSPLSKGLFHRAISLSGAIGSIPFDRDLLTISKRVAKRAGCGFDEPHSFTTCVQNKISSKKLMESCVAEKAEFTAVYGGSFMPENPELLLKNRQFSNNVPLIIGVTNGENQFLLSHRYHSKFYFLGNNTNYEDCFKYIHGMIEVLRPKQDVSKLVDEITKLYLGGKKDPIALHHSALEAVQDAWFTFPAHRFAKTLLASGQKEVYFYQFRRKPEFYKKRYHRPYRTDTADHMDDLTYIFGFPFIEDVPLHFSEKEKHFSLQLIEKLAHFAKNGNPNTNSKELSWKPFPSYVVFSNDSLQNYDEKFLPNKMKIME